MFIVGVACSVAKRTPLTICCVNSVMGNGFGSSVSIIELGVGVLGLDLLPIRTIFTSSSSTARRKKKEELIKRQKTKKRTTPELVCGTTPAYLDQLKFHPDVIGMQVSVDPQC